jgi:hypothetical protein
MPQRRSPSPSNTASKKVPRNRIITAWSPKLQTPDILESISTPRLTPLVQPPHKSTPLSQSAYFQSPADSACTVYVPKVSFPHWPPSQTTPLPQKPVSNSIHPPMQYSIEGYAHLDYHRAHAVYTLAPVIKRECASTPLAARDATGSIRISTHTPFSKAPAAAGAEHSIACAHRHLCPQDTLHS